MRLNRLRTYLTTHSLIQALCEAGFNSPSVLYDSTHHTLGMTPKVYKNGGTNETISFALAQTSLGAICVAQSQKGVCFVQFSEDPATTLQQLQDTFPLATLQARSAFDSTMAQIVGLVDHAIPTDLPIDAQGTVFQKKVWDALRHIPIGEVWSYKQVAEHLQMPTSVRAVASACARNNIALLVPCHRVVHTSGKKSEYRWGVARKQALLSTEFKSKS